MIKAEILKRIVKDSFLTKTQAREVLNIILEEIGDALARGEKVTFVGFGTFRVVERPARKGRNPRTGKTIEIPAKKVVKFIPGKALKERINK